MNPTVYVIDDHQIPLTAVDPDALRVVNNLQKAGHVAYIVGGGVRDLLLQQRPKDYDISTSAKPEEIKELFGANACSLDAVSALPISAAEEKSSKSRHLDRAILKAIS
jgi:tRNA nucleotidyltransferase/poly(A) polymerase